MKPQIHPGTTWSKPAARAARRGRRARRRRNCTSRSVPPATRSSRAVRADRHRGPRRALHQEVRRTDSGARKAAATKAKTTPAKGAAAKADPGRQEVGQVRQRLGRGSLVPHRRTGHLATQLPLQSRDPVAALLHCPRAHTLGQRELGEAPGHGQVARAMLEVNGQRLQRVAADAGRRAAVVGNRLPRLHRLVIPPIPPASDRHRP